MSSRSRASTSSKFTVGGSILTQQKLALATKQVLNNLKQTGGKKLLDGIVRKWKHEVHRLSRHLRKQQGGNPGDDHSAPFVPNDESSKGHVEQLIAYYDPSKKSSVMANGARNMMDSDQQKAAIAFAQQIVDREHSNNNMTKIAVDHLRDIDSFLNEFLEQSATDGKTITGLNAKVVELEEKLANASHNLADAQKGVEHAMVEDANAGMTVAEMKDTIENLQAELAKAKEFEKLAAAKMESRADITPEQVAELKKGLVAKDDELTAIRQELKTLQEKLQQSADAAAHEDEQKSISGKNAIVELEKKLAEATAQRDTVTAELNVLSATAANNGVSLDGKVKAIADELVVANADLAKAKEEVVAAKYELASEQKKYAELQTAFEQLQKKLEDEVKGHIQTREASVSMNNAFSEVMAKLDLLYSNFVDSSTFKDLERGAQDRLKSISSYAVISNNILVHYKVDNAYPIGIDSKFSSDDRKIFKLLIQAMQLESAWGREIVLKVLATKYSHDESVTRAVASIKAATENVTAALRGDNEMELKNAVNMSCPRDGMDENFYCTVNKLAVIDTMLAALSLNFAKYPSILTIIAEIRI
jgi:DNA repair exonuclease SbcCD ATPase subunit